MSETTEPITGFAATGITPVLLNALTAIGITEPTPIQERAIPIAMMDVDLIGVAQTGTGKTFAFGLPLLEKLRTNPGRGLIIVPTRELAMQVEESLRKVTGRLQPPIHTVVLIGGMSMNRQIDQLRRNPRIIIATPGRLNDHIQQGTCRLGDVRTLILDEADRMLDMGFLPQIKRILETVPTERQTMLFSATMAPEIARLAGAYMKDPVRVEVARPGTAAEQIEQQLCYVDDARKPEVLQTLLDRYEGSILVFSRTKHGASKLSRRLSMIGYEAAEIHSNRSLGQRKQALDGFKSGKYRVLVATDLAARGIDVTGIAVVVNYDLPDVAEDYVHRIGRTGRAGKTGLAISLAGHDQVKDVRIIEKLMNQPLALSEFSDQPRQTMAPRGITNSRTGINRAPARNGGSSGGGSWRRGR